TGRVLDALVDGQDRDVTRPGQPAVIEQLLEAAQHGGRAVREGEDAVDEVRPWQVQGAGGNLRRVGEQFGILAEKSRNTGAHDVIVSPAENVIRDRRPQPTL